MRAPLVERPREPTLQRLQQIPTKTAAQVETPGLQSEGSHPNYSDTDCKKFEATIAELRNAVSEKDRTIRERERLRRRQRDAIPSQPVSFT